MASNRIERTNSDIRFVLSRLIGEVKDPRISGRMISVTRVETTGDLRYCKVWLSVLDLDNEKDFRRGLKSASGWLRKELGQSLSLRFTPELTFEIDRSIEYGAHINAVLSSLNIGESDAAATDEDIAADIADEEGGR